MRNKIHHKRKLGLNYRKISSSSSGPPKKEKFFVHNESYKHRYAKLVLSQWLSSPEGFKDLDLPKEQCRGDGIFEEYPLVNLSKKYGHKCDDRVLAFNFPTSDGRCEFYSEVMKNVAPTFEKCVAYKEFPIAILDVACISNGVVVAGFEVKHRSKVTPEKKKKLMESFGHLKLPIYEISADKILNHVRKPDMLLHLCKRVF